MAERSMLGAVDPDAGSQPAAWPGTAPDVDQWIEDDVSEYEMNSRDAAFETWLSEQPWNQPAELDELDETVLAELVRETMARSRLPNSPLRGPELPANGHESPARAD